MTSGPSLHRYLLTRLLWVVLPIVLGGMAVHGCFQRRLLEDQFDAALVEKATVLATLVTGDRESLQLDFADEFMPEYSRAERPFVFQVWYPDGRSLERSYSLHGQDLPFRRGPLAEPAVFEATLGSGTRLRCVGVEFPARLGKAPHGPSGTSVVIAVGAGLEQLEAALEKGRLEVAITGIVSVAGIAVFVFLALRRGVRLLRTVVAEVEGLSPGTLGKPLDEERAPDEIRPIVASLNRSREALRALVERERRFTADVAHELRTPIAERRAAADVALRWPDEDSRNRLGVDARAISLQMGSLVESLLELATIESDCTGEPVEPFDLRELVLRVVEHARRSHGASREIEVDAPEAVSIESRPRLWEVAARNLLDNAISYSPAGARIRVIVRRDGDGASLAVSNPTQSIDAASLPRCTERLWRADRRPGDASHFGLGLSIVQAACDKLGHRLELGLEAGVFHAAVSRTAAFPLLG
ncbi:MAG: sensor histidine kinase [Planctomycetota bacterium]